jgi:hypothetical protein
MNHRDWPVLFVQRLQDWVGNSVVSAKSYQANVLVQEFVHAFGDLLHGFIDAEGVNSYVAGVNHLS